MEIDKWHGDRCCWFPATGQGHRRSFAGHRFIGYMQRYKNFHEDAASVFTPSAFWKRVIRRGVGFPKGGAGKVEQGSAQGYPRAISQGDAAWPQVNTGLIVGQVQADGLPNLWGRQGNFVAGFRWGILMKWRCWREWRSGGRCRGSRLLEDMAQQSHLKAKTWTKYTLKLSQTNPGLTYESPASVT